MTMHPRIAVVRTVKGKLRLDFDGVPVDGIVNIDCVDDAGGGRAEVIVTFLANFVHFETETPSNGEN
jgi:hypothetical protein